MKSTSRPFTIESLRARLQEAEQTLQAIRTGEVDALVVSGPAGDQVFSLRGADAGYRAMVEQMQEGAVTVDSSGLILYANRRFTEMLGRTPGEAVGKQLELYLEEGDRLGLRHVLEASSVPIRQGIHLRSASGRLMPVQLSISRLQDPESQAMYVLVISDLTLFHQKEQSLRSERLTRSILDNATEAIVVCDAQALVIEANPAAAALCAGEPRGRSFLDAFPLRMDDPGLVVAKALSGSVVRGATARMRSGEKTMSLLVSAGPLYGAGERTGCVISLVDDTPRAHAQEELRQLNETLEQRVVERSVVAQQKARQLRVLASELAHTEQRERARLAQVLHDHLQQLLVASSLKAGRLRRQKLPRPIADQAEQIEDLMRQAIQASRDLTLELSPPILYEAGLGSALRWLARQMQERHALVVEVDAPEATPGSIEGLGLFLFTAARELLFNVVKHGEVPTARIALRLGEDNEVHLSVEDRGRGFDTSALEQPKAGGFGLFSIRDRLDLLGGRLEVESSPGGGTRVTLVAPMIVPQVEAAEPFPLKLMPGAVDTPVLSEACQDASLSGGRPMRILLADDHTILRQGLASLLANEPDMETIAEASTGAEAVELTRLLRPDVIVMDASMPEMSGLEATRHIVERFPQTVVVGLSMYDSEDMSDAMRAAGARAYVTKEKASEELCGVIRTLVESQRGAQASSRSTAAPAGRTIGRRASSSKP